MKIQEVEKYRKPVRVLHWIHSGAFVLLFLTGLVLFIPQLAFLAQDSWTRVIHRIAALIFIIVPLLYLILSPKAALRGLKQAFTWGMEDTNWLKAAPRYYFLGDESAMPAQGSMNSGQKMWWLFTVVFGIIFIVTGLVMWFAKTSAPAGVLQWMIFIHDISFIVTGAMFFLHLYLGIFHPMMTEAWNSMAKGKISINYAKAHHGKWYDEISKDKEGKA
jgi:formate dehydrogenase subunit gamma